MTSPQASWLFFKARATSISESIRKERATQKNSQPAAARRVALKMGRRQRCSPVTYRFRYAPSLPPVRLGPPCRRPILNATTSPLYVRRYTRSGQKYIGNDAIQSALIKCQRSPRAIDQFKPSPSISQSTFFALLNRCESTRIGEDNR